MGVQTKSTRQNLSWKQICVVPGSFGAASSVLQSQIRCSITCFDWPIDTDTCQVDVDFRIVQQFVVLLGAGVCFILHLRIEQQVFSCISWWGCYGSAEDHSEASSPSHSWANNAQICQFEIGVVQMEIFKIEHASASADPEAWVRKKTWRVGTCICKVPIIYMWRHVYTIISIYIYLMIKRDPAWSSVIQFDGGNPWSMKTTWFNSVLRLPGILYVLF